MIPRYDKSEISSLWDENAKFSTYLEVELAILKSLEGSLVPPGTAEKIKTEAKINVDRINEIEATTRHDVIAFCTSITENLDAEVGKYFHFGVTSSDVIDTATVVQMKRSLDKIMPIFKDLLITLKMKAQETKEIICMGRSHGMYAEPMSFGQKILGHYNEFARRYQELQEFIETDLTVQYSGAVGNYTILTPEHEKKAANELGLKVEPASTQVIPRDRIAKMINIHSLIGSAIERLAVEIRHLHRSDVGELHEGFKKGQKGSSIMPHKKNPISAENLTGMARILRSHAIVAAENIVLWHERDISHSSAERMMLPDNFGILFYSLERLRDTIRDLVIHKEVIEARVYEGYNYLSSYYLHHLIEKTNFKREDLYYFVQEAAFAGSEAKSAEVFYEKLVEIMKGKGFDLELARPTKEEIKKIYTRHVDKVFERSFSLYNF